jgi:hypothetical protein
MSSTRVCSKHDYVLRHRLVKRILEKLDFTKQFDLKERDILTAYEPVKLITVRLRSTGVVGKAGCGGFSLYVQHTVENG